MDLDFAPGGPQSRLEGRHAFVGLVRVRLREMAEHRHAGPTEDRTLRRPVIDDCCGDIGPLSR